ADALDNPAMRLAFDGQRIHDGAEIVDHRIFDDLDDAGLGIELDLGDMAAIREGRGRRLGDEIHIERGGNALGQIDAGANAVGQIENTDRAVRADDGEAALAEFDIGGRGFEHHGGDLLAALDHLLARFDDRRAARHDRARAAGAAAEQQLVAVALQEADAVEGDAETVHQHLREGRVMALAVIERAGDDGDAAIRIEADAAHLLALRRGHFEIGADADAANLAVGAALFLALREA